MVRYLSLVTIFMLGLIGFGCDSTPARKAKTHTVEITQMKFVPETISVAPGDSIIWINRDIVEHDVVDKTDGMLKSEHLKMGESYAVKLDKVEAGKVFNYICSLHPIMKGQINVVKPE